ncbi:hypothetical protein ACFFX0_16220 [Citricoccus parietis]|uniref:Uncharacterized protein n=1 Tax=Citricoccus parietis TaxID=592307 RepID=A0ABV5G150_9MICC
MVPDGGASAGRSWSPAWCWRSSWRSCPIRRSPGRGSCRPCSRLCRFSARWPG